MKNNKIIYLVILLMVVNIFTMTTFGLENVEENKGDFKVRRSS